MGQEELLREYRRAGVLAMPCRVLDNDRDGIPNVLVEAMAAGAPVVATGVSGIPELVEDEVNGLLVEPDDPAALADALIRVHEDRELAQRARRRRPPHRAGALRRRPPRPPPRRPLRGGAPVKPVFSVIEHLHRDRAVAEDAVAGRFTCAGESRARHRAGLARRRPARRRGVADRLGQVLLRPRPRARLPRHGRHAIPRRLGAPRPLLPAPGPARQRPERGHRPPDRQLDLRLAGLRRPGQRARAGARRPDRRRGAPRPRDAHARAQPPHARAVRARDRRLRLRRRRAPRAGGRGARPQPGRGLPARRRAPRVLDALPHDRPALVRRPARERPPPRGRAAGRLRGAARPRRRVRPPLLPARRHDPRALRRRHRRLHAAARAARRRARGERTRASPTAATSRSAAAGASAS